MNYFLIKKDREAWAWPGHGPSPAIAVQGTGMGGIFKAQGNRGFSSGQPKPSRARYLIMSKYAASSQAKAWATSSINQTPTPKTIWQVP